MMLKVKTLVLLTMCTIIASGASAQDAVDVEEITQLAKQTLDRLQKVSYRNNAEYCGWIVIRGDELEATKASRGSPDGCSIPEQPEGTEVVASYHTHGLYGSEYYNEVPSMLDFTGDVEDGIFGYVGTPGGRVWIIDPDQEEVFLVCGEGCILQDPNYDSKSAWGTPSSFTARSLEKFLD